MIKNKKGNNEKNKRRKVLKKKKKESNFHSVNQKRKKKGKTYGKINNALKLKQFELPIEKRKKE